MKPVLGSDGDLLSPIRWADGRLFLLDQRLLPCEEKWRRCESDDDVARAIQDMVVRGAPAIGCAAAFGLALGAQAYPDERTAFREAFDAGAARLFATRPTAVNLAWAIDRQRAIVGSCLDRGVDAVRDALRMEALRILNDDQQSCRSIGRHGAALLPHGACVLTHCNAGALATGGYGTALGVIRAAAEDGKAPHVFADETRPYFQGARLTAWELQHSQIDVTLICDNMAGSLMQSGVISHCVVGADRIAANGDTANKIGTYMVAVLAARHRIPFIVAAPLSTIDMTISSGHQIPIEERDAREVTHLGDRQLAPNGIAVRNLAFDVTPHDLITAIVTERGVARPTFTDTFGEWFGCA